MSFHWRRWNNILHRDIGYLSVALVIVYGVSGLAVNHVADWNPNYSKEKSIFDIGPIVADSTAAIIAEAMMKIGLTEEPKNAFRPDPETVQLFYTGVTYTVDLPTGTVLKESNPPRRVLFEMNQLHLNSVKGVWTYIADLFAVALIFLGISGLFMLKGKNGLGGRGKWFVSIGVAIPVIYWIYYIYG